MIITRAIWKSLATAIASIEGLPTWLKEQGRLDWEVVSVLPLVDATTDGQHALPSVEQKLMDADYLDFLREQIKLNARGPEWLTVLRERLAALEPFVGKELMTAVFHCKPHSATLRFNPETQKVIHKEIF